MNKELLKQKLIDLTKQNFSGFSRYEQFMKDSDQSEFARSQNQFYDAVKSFPAILCFLASNIDTSEARLKVAENIWEEHGNGDPNLFHTTTFKQFLNAINLDPNYKTIKNPYISDWVANWFQIENPFELAITLSAIEFLYAPISDSIATHLNNLTLNNEQSHYSKHAILDWEHGAELFDVALDIATLREKNDEDKIISLFDHSQKEFLRIYDSMLILTKKECHDIAKNKIAFYYQREDPAIICDLLKSNESLKNVLMVCSGGDSLLRILSYNSGKDIVAFDMNKNQIELAKDKINKHVDFIAERGASGKFEALFAVLRSRLMGSNSNPYHKLTYISEVKSNFFINDLFRNENLAIIFTDDAVKYTNKEFSEHFIKKINRTKNINDEDYKQENLDNIYLDQPFSIPEKKLDLINNKLRFEIVKVSSPDFFDGITFDDGKSYDVVDISNIGDWMSLDNFKEVLKTIYSKMNPEGYIIVRKLLADYDLKEELKQSGFVSIIPFIDHFYEESYICTKK